ncbi:MAG: MBL fold metallo-hydrolase [Kiritimatiellae bacterium]|nr:MBL fold metallo-hydrolase [Kiritimatiellia bacterium]
MNMNRRSFCAGMFAAAVAAKAARGADAADGAELDLRQREIDAITPDEFAAYWRPGIELAKDELDAATRRFPVLGRLEAAFEKVLREVKETVVTDIDHPAVWYVYNMGLIVKSPKKTFSIDLHHRRAEDMAPLLDFALITHNHNDHYTERFTHLMDRVQHKTVVNNFFCNYGVTDRMKFGGYTRAKSKTFHIGDVTVITGLCDHNPYLIDYTTPFEVQIGNFTLYHSGDCYSHAKLHVSRQPDLWVLHPRCGMDPAKACAETIRPKKAVVAHLQELGHAKGRARWTYENGMSDSRRIEAAGFPAVMPLWGERLA